MGNLGLGRLMAAEMAEQPRVLAGLAGRFGDIARQARSAAGPGVAGVAFAARGSSDHAALLGRYAVELAAGLPTCLVAPSIATLCRRAPDGFRNWLLVALSQSGQTPEIVQLAEAFTAAGASVLAIVNEPGSPLAQAARQVVELDAGPERAVPATKTVTGQMLAVLAVAGGLGDRDQAAPDIGRIPDAMRAVLDDPEPVDAVAAAVAGSGRVAVVGRGACYPAARETALKLQESAGVMAHGFSTADFRHGPIAVSGPATPVVLLAGAGPADADTRELRGALVERGSPVTVIGAGDDADVGWPALDGRAGLAECLLATARGQQLALFTANALGLDPDRPTGLNKITLTR